MKSSYGRRPPTGGGLKVPGTALGTAAGAGLGPGGLASSRGRMPTAGNNILQGDRI